ncbi:MAG: hypothetical protein DSZ23_00050 [Thermodesulfatator sp.]|nr:MAG: hypothetical protein DSZ23_00050 [Thermodesulfatator sp.]
MSDPGARLVDYVRQKKIDVIPVPGPSAVTSALSVSGFPGRSFYFAGFLPSKSSERKERLKQLSSVDTVLVLYEAPHRLMKTLADILSVMGNRRIFFAKEMTKSHETYLSTTVARLLEKLDGEKILGEITMVMEGSHEKEEYPADMEALKKIITCLVSEHKLSVKEASATLSGLMGIKRGIVYNMALQIRGK